MENNTSTNHENGNDANRLLAAGFIPVAESKPNQINYNGSRAWVLAAWSDGQNEPLKVFADKIGTSSCTADFWKAL